MLSPWWRINVVLPSIALHLSDIWSESTGRTHSERCTACLVAHSSLVITLRRHLDTLIVECLSQSLFLRCLVRLLKAATAIGLSVSVRAHLLYAVQDFAVGTVFYIFIVDALLFSHPCHRGLVVEILGGLLRLDIICASNVLQVTWGLPH